MDFTILYQHSILGNHALFNYPTEKERTQKRYNKRINRIAKLCRSFLPIEFSYSSFFAIGYPRRSMNHMKKIITAITLILSLSTSAYEVTKKVESGKRETYNFVKTLISIDGILVLETRNIDYNKALLDFEWVDIVS